MNAESDKLTQLFSLGKEYYQDQIKGKFPDFSRIMDKKNPVIIYGAGRMGKIFKDNLLKNNINTLVFADSNVGLWGSKIDGIKIISPDELKKNYYNFPILVASLLYETEIYEMLLKMQFPFVYPICFLNYSNPDIFVVPSYLNKFSSLFKPHNQSQIYKVNELWDDEESKRVYYNIIEFRLTFDKDYLRLIKLDIGRQYLETEMLSLSPDEVFLDCGAYRGDTVKGFYDAVSGKFKKIYSFEPDRESYAELKAVIKRLNTNKIIPVNASAYKCTGKVGFIETGAIDSKIGYGNRDVELPAFSIDDFVKDKERPTYIKMDIEGSEIDALSGAKETIKKHKPKLAISVYHNDTDLWEIPAYIKELNDEYRLFLRHYTDEIMETVCYAV